MTVAQGDDASKDKKRASVSADTASDVAVEHDGSATFSARAAMSYLLRSEPEGGEGCKHRAVLQDLVRCVRPPGLDSSHGAGMELELAVAALPRAADAATRLFSLMAVHKKQRVVDDVVAHHVHALADTLQALARMHPAVDQHSSTHFVKLVAVLAGVLLRASLHSRGVVQHVRAVALAHPALLACFVKLLVSAAPHCRNTASGKALDGTSLTSSVALMSASCVMKLMSVLLDGFPSLCGQLTASESCSSLSSSSSSSSGVLMGTLAGLTGVTLVAAAAWQLTAVVLGANEDLRRCAVCEDSRVVPTMVAAIAAAAQSSESSPDLLIDALRSVQCLLTGDVARRTAVVRQAPELVGVLVTLVRHADVSVHVHAAATATVLMRRGEPDRRVVAEALAGADTVAAIAAKLSAWASLTETQLHAVITLAAHMVVVSDTATRALLSNAAMQEVLVQLLVNPSPALTRQVHLVESTVGLALDKDADFVHGLRARLHEVDAVTCVWRRYRAATDPLQQRTSLLFLRDLATGDVGHAVELVGLGAVDVLTALLASFMPDTLARARPGESASPASLPTVCAAKAIATARMHLVPEAIAVLHTAARTIDAPDFWARLRNGTPRLIPALLWLATTHNVTPGQSEAAWGLLGDLDPDVKPMAAMRMAACYHAVNLLPTVGMGLATAVPCSSRHCVICMSAEPLPAALVSVCMPRRTAVPLHGDGVVLPCLHVFHAQCVYNWFETSVMNMREAQCPMCRRNVLTDLNASLV